MAFCAQPKKQTSQRKGLSILSFVLRFLIQPIFAGMVAETTVPGHREGPECSSGGAADGKTRQEAFQPE